MSGFRWQSKVNTVLLVVVIALLSMSFLRSQAAPAAQEAAPMVMSQEDAEKFAEKFNAIFDGPSVDIADEIFSPDFVGHAPLAPKLDRDGWKAYVGSFYAAISDMKEQVNQVIVSKDRVVLHVTYTGMHDGPLFGIPATGKKISLDGIGIFSFDKDGLVTENWAVLDVVGLLAQIGAFPPAPAK